MTRSRYRFDSEHCPHFVTCTIVAWLSIFNRPSVVEIVYDSWRFLQREGLVLHGYVILDNHLHLIAAHENLSRAVARFKSYTARRIIDHLTEQSAFRRPARRTLPVAELARVQFSVIPELWRVQLRVSYFLPLALRFLNSSNITSCGTKSNRNISSGKREAIRWRSKVMR